SVCEMVYEGIQNNQTTKVEVNGTSAEDASACNKEEDNTIGFFFITNASEGGTTPEDLCKNKTCPEGYSCTHGICMSEELPQLHSNGASIGELLCKKDSECPECSFCSEWGGCKSKTDGTACSEGTCYNGRCIFNDDSCMSHDECEKGYFCEIGEYFQSHKCTKLEFYKTSLDNVYLLKHGTSMTELCDLAGFQAPTREQAIDILAKLESVFTSSAKIHTIDAGRCESSGECYQGGSGHGAVAYLLCIDNK
ncbi:MAG: hypothetical protein IKV03_02110, partial [Alphaproteobacteria bacterium]|nr:hypothetical protein [Alphaproteobacteria bacterium]